MKNPKPRRHTAKPNHGGTSLVVKSVPFAPPAAAPNEVNADHQIVRNAIANVKGNLPQLRRTTRPKQ